MSNYAFDVVYCLVWNMFLLAGATWLVWHGWSPWWFVLALLLTTKPVNDY